jgi:hypothetical protein
MYSKNGLAGPTQTNIRFTVAATKKKTVKAIALKGECEGGA